MAELADRRLLGLSPKARRFVVPFLALALILIVFLALATRRSNSGARTGGGTSQGPVVGGDLHAVAQFGNRTFAGGHEGAGFRSAAGSWMQIDSLRNTDVMGWASTSAGTVLAGGHSGLYRSVDDGAVFVSVANLSVSDVHALGAYRDRVYIASPQTGTLVSNNGGRTFSQVSTAGQDFMGTIWVDPLNPNVAIAPSMMSGAVKTSDGGTTWSALGSGSGAMAVAVDASGRDLLAVGMDGARQSRDAGKTWSPVTLAANTSAACYASDGSLLTGALVGDRAAVSRFVAGKWIPLA